MTTHTKVNRQGPVQILSSYKPSTRAALGKIGPKSWLYGRSVQKPTRSSTIQCDLNKFE